MSFDKIAHRDLSENGQYKVRLEILREEMRSERSSHMPQWEDLAATIKPNRIRHGVASQENRGERRRNLIVDCTGSLAARILQAGLMAGLTSPARPWFKLGTWDMELGKEYAVKAWLDEVQKFERLSFNRSNLYQALPTVYGDAGTFGTACMFHQPHPKEIARFYTFPPGQYMIANDGEGRVRTFIREFELTIREVVNIFCLRDDGTYDLDKLDPSTQEIFKNGREQTKTQIVHIIKLNDFWRPNSPLSKHKKYSSEYYEQGISTTAGNLGSPFNTVLRNDKFLSRSGYDFFPVYCPRWEVAGQDAYGTDCPGMMALGDIKQLQTGELDSMEAVTKMVRPPLWGTSEMARHASTAHIPGHITYGNARDGGKPFESIYDVDFRVDYLEVKQDKVRGRINEAFLKKMFVALLDTTRRQITAREVEEVSAEKLLSVGPTLAQFNQDLLDPLIENQFAIMNDMGLLPEPPEELQGKDLRIEYVSVLAQAQKAASLGQLENFASFVYQVSKVREDALDKINLDNMIDDYAEMIGVEVDNINDEETVINIRTERARMREEQAQLAQQREEADMAQKLGNTPVKDPSGEDVSALDKLIEQQGGPQLEKIA